MPTKNPAASETDDDGRNDEDQGQGQGQGQNPPSSGSHPNPPPRSKGPGSRDEDLPEDVESLRDLLRQTKAALSRSNRESAERRHKVEELEQAEEQRKTASLGEADRLKKQAKDAADAAAEAKRRADAAEQAMERQQIDIEVERQATRMGFLYPDIVPTMIDRRLVERDPETGKIEGVKCALERLAKERPLLLDASPRGGTPPREGPRRTGERDGGRNGRQEGNPIEDELRGSGKYV